MIILIPSWGVLAPTWEVLEHLGSKLAVKDSRWLPHSIFPDSKASKTVSIANLICLATYERIVHPQISYTNCFRQPKHHAQGCWFVEWLVDWLLPCLVAYLLAGWLVVVALGCWLVGCLLFGVVVVVVTVAFVVVVVVVSGAVVG